MPSPPPSPSHQHIKPEPTIKLDSSNSKVQPTLQPDLQGNKVQPTATSFEPIDTAEMPALTRAVLSPYKFTPPGRFSGVPSGDSMKDIEAALSWIESMDDYLRQSKLICSPWSDLLEAEIATSMLDLDARKVARRLRDRHGPQFSWSILKVDLAAAFAPAYSPIECLAKLVDCKQGDKPLRAYITSFEGRLEDAIRAGFSDAVMSSKLFLDGLVKPLKLSMLDFLSLDENAWPKIRAMDPYAAIRYLSAAAIRRNEAVIQSASGNTNPPRINAVKTSHTTDARANSAKDGAAPKPDTRAIGREQLVVALCRRFNLEEGIVRNRLDTNACVRCGALDHVSRACKLNEVSSPAPAPAAGQPKDNAR